MAGYDFPTSPPYGTTVTVPDGSIRVWDGTKWRAAPSSDMGTPGVYLPLIGGTLTGQTFLNMTDPPLGQSGISGGISSALVLNVGSSPGSTIAFPWAISSVFTSASTVGGHQEGGIASQVIKAAGSNAGTWQFFGNTKEISGRGYPYTSGANVSTELNLLCNGPDNPASAFNPGIGFRTYFTLASRTYKPPNWTPTTDYALNTSVQPVSGRTWTAVTPQGIGDIVRPTGGAIPQSAFQCTRAGTTGSTEPVWNIVLGGTVVDGGVTWVNINNSGNGYTYFCTVAGRSGATEPVWPLVPGGTVVDGGVTWQYGTTLKTQISRVIGIGDSDHGAVSYGSALHVTSPIYDAICEFSGASLDTLFNPNAAAIRLASDMPIDFTGNLTPAGQNNHTLRYTHGSSGFPYSPVDAGFGRLSYQVDLQEPAWSATTFYPANSTILPSVLNQFMYISSADGTSGATEPVWPVTVGATISDGTVTWTAVPSNQELFKVDDIGITTVGNPYTTTAVLALDCAVGQQRQLRFEAAGSLRWAVLTGSQPEPGGNVGSDFRIRRYNDAGAVLGDALTITRSTGAVSFGGPVTLPSDGTSPLHAATVQQVNAATSPPPGQIAVPPGGSIQAALDALPSTGGTVTLAANTVYTVTALITTTKPNVRVTAPSWSTVLRRDPGYNSAGQLALMGANSVMEGFTIDGNSVTGTQFECSVGGANCLVRNMQIINGAGTGHLNLSGQNSRATGNTITGLGTSPSTQRGYGIWAISHVTVLIEGNTITGTGIDGIGFDGQGTRVIGNNISNCHCWTGGQGGQIASYNATLGGVGNSSAVIGNTIGPAGSPQGQGIESWMQGEVISGNTLDGITQAAIIVFGNGATVTGNSIRNCGGTADAIVVPANVTDVAISGNRIADDQATPTMRYGISVYAGSSNRLTITGNLITGYTSAAISDPSTGTSKTIANNLNANASISGNSMIRGTQQVGDGTAAATLQLAGALGAGVTRGLMIYTGATTGGTGQRWQLGASNNTSEPGSNAGTDFGLFSYADNGAFIANPLLVTRATGLATINNGLSFGSATAASVTDFSKHIAVWGTTNGISFTTSRFNYVSGGSSAHYFVVGSTDMASIGSGGMRVIGNVGFNNTAPIAKPTLSGAWAGNAAGKALATILANYGLLTDTSTA